MVTADTEKVITELTWRQHGVTLAKKKRSAFLKDLAKAGIVVYRDVADIYKYGGDWSTCKWYGWYLNQDDIYADNAKNILWTRKPVKNEFGYMPTTYLTTINFRDCDEELIKKVMKDWEVGFVSETNSLLAIRERDSKTYYGKVVKEIPYKEWRLNLNP